MRIREVKLIGGPLDGSHSTASHDTAQTDCGPYVYNGGDDPDQFGHAETLVGKLPEEQQAEERQRITEWLEHPGTPSGVKRPDGTEFMIPAPMAMCIGIPPWRINAWVQVVRPGSLSV